MARIPYNENLSYEIFTDGYDIFNSDNPQPDIAWLTQREPYARLFVVDGTYEENALAQLKTLLPPEHPIPTETDKIRADIDYLALMLDVDLPSQEGE